MKNILNSTGANDERTQKLLAYYKRYTNDVAHYYDLFTKLLRQKHSEIRMIQKEISKLDSMETELSSNVSLLISDDTPLSDDETYTTETKTEIEYETIDINDIKKSTAKIVNYFITYSIEEDKPITVEDITEHFSISPAYLLKKIGGFKHVQKLAKSTLFHRMFPLETIKKLKLYKIEHGEYPKRPVLTKNFISQRNLAKLNKVFRSKRITNLIYELVDSITIESESESESESEEEVVE